MVNVLAIIQARMSSRRFPGKIMKRILDKPLLGYLLERLKASRRIDGIVIAASNNSNDDIMCRFVEELKFDVFRGDEQDVLSRIYHAALEKQPEHILRVTADCPLFDPDICDRLITFYFDNSVDYAYTGQKFAEGLDCEVFSFPALKKAFQETELLSEREHVAKYLYDHPELFQTKCFENNVDDGKYRITLDEPEDFNVLKAIIEALYPQEKLFGFKDIKVFLDAHPEIMKINQHIVRNEGYLKSLKEDCVVK